MEPRAGKPVVAAPEDEFCSAAPEEGPTAPVPDDTTEPVAGADGALCPAPPEELGPADPAAEFAPDPDEGAEPLEAGPDETPCAWPVDEPEAAGPTPYVEPKPAGKVVVPTVIAPPEEAGGVGA